MTLCNISCCLVKWNRLHIFSLSVQELCQPPAIIICVAGFWISPVCLYSGVMSFQKQYMKLHYILIQASELYLEQWKKQFKIKVANHHHSYMQGTPKFHPLEPIWMQTILSWNSWGQKWAMQQSATSSKCFVLGKRRGKSSLLLRILPPCRGLDVGKLQYINRSQLLKYHKQWALQKEQKSHQVLQNRLLNGVEGNSNVGSTFQERELQTCYLIYVRWCFQ